MSIKMYGYKGCGTCRKAIKWLQDKGLEFKDIPIREKTPPKTALKKGLAYTGSIRKLFNTSGGAYKEQKIKDILPDLSDAQAIDLLVSDGNLIKRPVLISGDTVLVGFKADDWEAALG